MGVGGLIAPAKCGGNKRTVDVREVVNGLMYVLSTGCQWRAIRRTCRRDGATSDPIDRISSAPKP
jgi:transposase